jgi:hypothetical protein
MVTRAEAAKLRGVNKSTKNTVTAIVTGSQLSSRFASGGPNARLSCVRSLQHVVVRRYEINHLKRR